MLDVKKTVVSSQEAIKIDVCQSVQTVSRWQAGEVTLSTTAKANSVGNTRNQLIATCVKWPANSVRSLLMRNNQPSGSIKVCQPITILFQN